MSCVPGLISDIGVVGDGLKTYPDIGAPPFERKFGDDKASISTAEFTIFETMSHNALYTVLSNGGTWDEKLDPYADPATGNRYSTAQTTPAISGSMTADVQMRGGVLNVSLVLPASGSIKVELFMLNGKRIFQFFSGTLRIGSNSITIPIGSEKLLHLTNGIGLCRITGPNDVWIGEKVIAGFK